MNRRILGILAGLAGLGVYFVIKFVVLPKVELSQKKHSQWNDARPELQARYHPGLKPFLSRLPPAKGRALEKCFLDRIIVFLNQTGCDYYYVSTTTSRAEFLKKQDACLKKAGLKSKELEILAACLQEHFPRNWNYAERDIAASFEKTFSAKISDPAARRKLAACAARETVAVLNASSCKPVNAKATKLEEVLRTPDACFDRDKALLSKVSSRVKQACLGAGTPAARPRSRPASRHRRRRRHR